MLKKSLMIVALLMAVNTAASAQANLTELVRSDMRTQAQTIMTAAMQLSNDDAEKFWPVYREYELERSKWGDQRLAFIKSYAEQYESITDEAAKQLADQWFKLHENRLKLWKDYYKKFEKEISSSVAARFIQVENQLNMVLDIQIAQELPLIFKPEM